MDPHLAFCDPNAICGIVISYRYRCRSLLLSVVPSSPIVYLFALVASTMFETVAARCCFWPVCTVSHFVLAPHSYLRSARAPLLKFWEVGSRSAHDQHSLRAPPTQSHRVGAYSPRTRARSPDRSCELTVLYIVKRFPARGQDRRSR
eukprot:6213282-Pleurochrysis_carterae.AAC.1